MWCVARAETIMKDVPSSVHSDAPVAYAPRSRVTHANESLAGCHRCNSMRCVRASAPAFILFEHKMRSVGIRTSSSNKRSYARRQSFEGYARVE